VKKRGRSTLADVPLRQFLDEPIVPYDDDEVTRLIVDTHDVKRAGRHERRRVPRLALAL
jgi:ethanolamine ammonia-lyase large subunit